MRLSKRIANIPPYPFVEITRKINQKRSEGVDVITFAIGDPDIPTPKHIMDSFHAAADDPANHRYPESDGLPELRKAIAAWYNRRFGVSLDADKEVLPLIGSKEGIANIAYAWSIRATSASCRTPATRFTAWAPCSPAARRTTCR